MNNIAAIWILFILWPFSAFIAALRKGFDKHYQAIILAFAFLYGYSVYLYGGDILDFKEEYHAISLISWHEYIEAISTKLDIFSSNTHFQLYNFTDSKPDIYAVTLQFVLSRFSDSPRLFWGIVSLIYVKFFLMFLNQVKINFEITSLKRYHYIYIAFLVLVVPFYVGVTGVRFWTALFLFVYLLFKFLNTDKSKYIGYMPLSILIHYSFFVPVSILLVIFVVPLKKWFTILLVYASIIFFITTSTTTVFNYLNKGVSMFEETSLEESVSSYADQSLVQKKQIKHASTNWYVRLRSDSVFYLLIFAFLLEFTGIIRLNTNKITQKLYPYLIVFFAVALIGYNLGSIGRFKNIFYLLAFARYAIIFPININSKYLKYLAMAFSPILVLYVLVTFRGGFYTIDPLLLVSNPIILFLTRSSESLSEFLIGH